MGSIGREFTVIVAGGGASGTLFAAEFMRRAGRARVVIVEPRERLGAGTAYSTDCPGHVLNVPAAKMSAHSGDADHFVRWLRDGGYEQYDGASFVPRSIYGAYLNAVAARAASAAKARWRHVLALVSDARIDGDGVHVTLSNGETFVGDALVIASGNAEPATWPHVAAGRSKRFFDSAWNPEALAISAPHEHTLVLGTGLTAVDAVLALRHNGQRGTVHMVSRRGLLPHEHRLFDTPPAACPEAETLGDLFDAVRASARRSEATDGNWRKAVDGLRPQTNALWQSLTFTEQRRFLVHALPYWNAHRHRMAPEVAQRLTALVAAGDLRMIAGRVVKIAATEREVCIRIQPRGGGRPVALSVGRVINCSGPEHDFEKLSSPLVRHLLERGLMVPSPLRVGVQIAPNGALIGSAGGPSGRLFAIGPVRYGTLIETTAIPEIRTQACELAELLASGTETASRSDALPKRRLESSQPA